MRSLGGNYILRSEHLRSQCVVKVKGAKICPKPQMCVNNVFAWHSLLQRVEQSSHARPLNSTSWIEHAAGTLTKIKQYFIQQQNTQHSPRQAHSTQTNSNQINLLANKVYSQTPQRSVRTCRVPFFVYMFYCVRAERLCKLDPHNITTARCMRCSSVCA